MSTRIEFLKMHGLGNDFVVVDARPRAFVPSPRQARWIGNRRWGIGCDQLIVMEPSTKADVFMRIYNSDGSQAEACGNATRCVAGLLAQEGVTTPRIETLRGVLEVVPAGDNMFTVNMGAPIFDPQSIPVLVDDHLVLPRLLPDFEPPIALSMGNPHCVFFGKGVENIDLQGLGRRIETDPLFPQRTNVQFVELLGRDRIRQRVFERGAGITGASGSGACAGAVASMIKGLVKDHVEVVLDGGSLWIEWAGTPDAPVLMTGPWAESFKGSVMLVDDNG